MYDSDICGVSGGGNSGSWKISDGIITKNYVGVQAYAFTGRKWVVGVPVIICVEKLLEPLEEFEIVLETALDQFVDRYYLNRQLVSKVTIGIDFSKILFIRYS